MKFNDSDSDGAENEQNTNSGQNRTVSDGSGESPMRAPEAASKRDVQEAERKAEEAHAVATTKAEEVRAELEEEVEELREIVADYLEVLEDLEEHQEALLENGKHRFMGKSFSEKEEPSALKRARKKLSGSSGGDGSRGA